MDIVSSEIRTKIMSSIRSKNTKPELIIRKSLHALGFRYRLHVKTLSGCPDIVFPKYRAVINVHGCFWHGHGCYLFKEPETRSCFWKKKIEGNKKRDLSNMNSLLSSGWRVAIVWECAVKGKWHLKEIENLALSIGKWLKGKDKFIEFSGGNSSTDMLRYNIDSSSFSIAENPINSYLGDN